MTVYADYTYYTTQYLGTAIAQADFDALALRASAHIDRMTFGRAATDTDNTTAIKNAMCAVAEELQKQQSSPDAVQSESQGQYSVSYARNSSAMKSNQSKLESAAKLYLDGTFLMFPGFNNGEYGHDHPDAWWWYP